MAIERVCWGDEKEKEQPGTKSGQVKLSVPIITTNAVV